MSALPSTLMLLAVMRSRVVSSEFSIRWPPIIKLLAWRLASVLLDSTSPAARVVPLASITKVSPIISIAAPRPPLAGVISKIPATCSDFSGSSTTRAASSGERGMVIPDDTAAALTICVSLVVRIVEYLRKLVCDCTVNERRCDDEKAVPAVE